MSGYTITRCAAHDQAETLDLVCRRCAESVSRGVGTMGDLMGQRDAALAREARLAAALGLIAAWELPLDYERDYGSNGARDFMRTRATRALATDPAPLLAACRAVVGAERELRSAPAHERDCAFVGCGVGCPRWGISQAQQTAVDSLAKLIGGDGAPLLAACRAVVRSWIDDGGEDAGGRIKALAALIGGDADDN